MKKYIIIAAAALVAAAACSKVENTIEAPEEAISFKVVDYATATRADANKSLISEKIYSFKTYAWMHADGAATGTAFMTPATIVPNNQTSPSEWAPEGRTYYWPKSEGSYINFFSFASIKNTLPTSITDGTASYGTEEAPITIATDENILVADAAYRYSKNAKTYLKDQVKEGVPTLFHHMLSKVYFDVNLDASAVEEGYHFKVEITKATVSYANQGSISLSFSDPGSTGPSTITTAGWVPGENKSTLTGNSVTLEADGGEIYPAADAKPAYLPLIDTCTVLPQVLSIAANPEATPAVEAKDLVTISLEYKLTSQYTGTDPVTETIKVNDVPLASFSEKITEWAMNYKYIYHITINPVSGEKILFDPAVEVWNEKEAGSITVPVK